MESMASFDLANDTIQQCDGRALRSIILYAAYSALRLTADGGNRLFEGTDHSFQFSKVVLRQK